MNTRTKNTTAIPGTELTRGMGLHGRVTLFAAMAGGIGLGGYLVAALTLAGRLSAHAIFLTSTGLFIIGAFLGLMHGAVLGFFGRARETEPGEALKGLLRSTLYAVPGLAVSWLVTVWIAMTPVAAYADRIAPWVGVGMGAVAGLVVMGFFVRYGWQALRNAYARWPERRMGTLLTGAFFAALTTTLLADRPELWGLRVQVTQVGAILLAVFGTIWVGGPVVTAGLHLVKRLPGRIELFHTGTGAATDVALGLTVGLVMSLLVLPFNPTAGVATGAAGGSLILAVSQALVDEVLLRLFLVSAIAWLLLRWHRMHKEEAAVIAVTTAALVQVLLYLPGVVAVGFPTTLAAVGFTLVAILIPALVFGALYWARGLGTALVADAATLAGIAIIAAL